MQIIYSIVYLKRNRSADLLSVVFERFPDRDYLIITVPHMVPEFNLLQHFVVRHAVLIYCIYTSDTATP